MNDGLPEKLTLSVEYKEPGWWIVKSPEHPGLYVAHRSLSTVMEDVPRSLAMLIKLNAEATITTGTAS